MLNDFREFVTRGNVLDLAVGVMVGAAFSKIVDSLVNDILMPPFGVLLGGIDFSDFFINLGSTKYESLSAAKLDNAATINYGMFLNNVISFFIVAFAIFMLVRQVNKLRKPKVKGPPTQGPCPFCQMTVSLAATRCPHCTSTLKSPALQPT